jgi:hypothetical protein
MVSSCEIISLYGYFFPQLRWKPFEIPKASEKKVDFVSVSQYPPRLPTALLCPAVNDLAICDLDAEQPKPEVEAAETKPPVCSMGAG